MVRRWSWHREYRHIHARAHWSRQLPHDLQGLLGVVLCCVELPVRKAGPGRLIHTPRGRSYSAISDVPESSLPVLPFPGVRGGTPARNPCGIRVPGLSQEVVRSRRHEAGDEDPAILSDSHAAGMSALPSADASPRRANGDAGSCDRQLYLLALRGHVASRWRQGVGLTTAEAGALSSRHGQAV